MRIQLLDSTCGQEDRRSQYATSFLVNGSLAIDCGALGFWKTADDQARVRNVILTHTHADHLASLPIFVENAYVPGQPPVRLWGSESVLACLREDVFNDRMFPNLLELPSPEEPFATLSRLDAEVPIDIDGVRITPVPLNHTVPTFGLLLDDGHSSVAIVSDTGPTERIWTMINALPNLKAVYLEATFPNDMRELARVSCHLTSDQFGVELRKLKHAVPVLAVHLKARYQERVAAEVRSMALDCVRIVQPGREDVW